MHERLQRLERHVSLLEKFRAQHTPEEILQNEFLEWALRYGLFEAIQMIINISCHLASERRLGHPTTYSECVELLVKYGYLDESLGELVQRMIGLRNILVHEYIRIDDRRLVEYLERLDDIRAFIEQLHERM
ncbi:MAG: DUF86 domain-containing protein [Chloroflexi bacterium]|nr:DUF86 domain-containing protein [Chloroflexota bacterium]